MNVCEWVKPCTKLRLRAGLSRSHTADDSFLKHCRWWPWPLAFPWKGLLVIDWSMRWFHRNKGHKCIIPFILLSCYLSPFNFPGWTISRRYWTGIRDSDQVCSLFADRHGDWRPGRHPGAVPALGQGLLLSAPAGGEAAGLGCAGRGAPSESQWMNTWMNE